MDTVDISKLTNLDYYGNEAFKTLRSNIGFCGRDIKVIGFTSCTPNEGKSIVSLNLAVSLAEAGYQVAYVDANLRKSSMIGRHRVSEPIRGISQYLSGIYSEEEIIYQTNTDDLYMIFSGPVPPNPSELLSGEKFYILTKILSEAFDYVIIDTPPLGSVIDSAVIAKLCDGMIMVIEANAVSYKLAQKVKAQSEKTDCIILGAVLNKVEVNENGFFGK